jgi:hypothetical protein
VLRPAQNQGLSKRYTAAASFIALSHMAIIAASESAIAALAINTSLLSEGIRSRSAAKKCAMVGSV